MGGTVTELARFGYGRAPNAPHANILHFAEGIIEIGETIGIFSDRPAPTK